MGVPREGAAVHVTVIWLSPPVATTLLGAPGVAAGVTLAVAQALSPHLVGGIDAQAVGGAVGEIV